MQDEILNASALWAQAIRSRLPDKVIERYHPNAVLWGTLAKEIRYGHQRIKDYFNKFLQRDNLNCSFNESIVRIYEDFAFHSGTYEFSWRVADKSIVVPARFSFVYKNDKGKWLIIEHHSSLFPDQQFILRDFISIVI
jgi:hypothetical protein